MSRVYVSITGLQLRAIWHAPRFWTLAMPAMAAAQTAPGNLSASARTVSGVHHTLTTWDSAAAMRAYLTSDSHRRAVAAFPRIAEGKTHGYWSDGHPTWDDALDHWAAHGRVYRVRG